MARTVLQDIQTEGTIDVHAMRYVKGGRISRSGKAVAAANESARVAAKVRAETPMSSVLCEGQIRQFGGQNVFDKAGYKAPVQAKLQDEKILDAYRSRNGQVIYLERQGKIPPSQNSQLKPQAETLLVAFRQQWDNRVIYLKQSEASDPFMKMLVKLGHYQFVGGGFQKMYTLADSKGNIVDKVSETELIRTFGSPWEQGWQRQSGYKLVNPYGSYEKVGAPSGVSLMKDGHFELIGEGFRKINNIADSKGNVVYRLSEADFNRTIGTPQEQLWKQQGYKLVDSTYEKIGAEAGRSGEISTMSPQRWSAGVLIDSARSRIPSGQQAASRAILETQFLTRFDLGDGAVTVQKTTVALTSGAETTIEGGLKVSQTGGKQSYAASIAFADGRDAIALDLDGDGHVSTTGNRTISPGGPVGKQYDPWGGAAGKKYDPRLTQGWDAGIRAGSFAMGKDAFLATDVDGDGMITRGDEIIRRDNLASFDTNGDGKINKADAGYSRIKLVNLEARTYTYGTFVNPTRVTRVSPWSVSYCTGLTPTTWALDTGENDPLARSFILGDPRSNRSIGSYDPKRNIVFNGVQVSGWVENVWSLKEKGINEIDIASYRKAQVTFNSSGFAAGIEAPAQAPIRDVLLNEVKGRVGSDFSAVNAVIDLRFDGDASSPTAQIAQIYKDGQVGVGAGVGSIGDNDPNKNKVPQARV